MCAFSIILILKGIKTLYSQGVHAFCWTKMQTLIKTRSRSKIENSTHTSRDEPCTSAHLRITNKSTTMMSWSSQKKKCIFCTIYLVWRNFFNICVLSKFIAYWTNFQTIWTFTSQKTLLHTLKKSSKASSIS